VPIPPEAPVINMLGISSLVCGSKRVWRDGGSAASDGAQARILAAARTQ